MPLRPRGRESKAISWPSGDHRGVPVAGPPKKVSWTACEPSASQTHISELPERSEAKTICLPSGENCGLSCARPEAINFTGELPRGVEPDTSTCQIAVLANQWV